MFSGASVAINGGTINNATNMNIIHPKRGIDFLMEFIATDALHDSKELYDAPKCHAHTRVAVLDDIMEWVIKTDTKMEDDFIMWLFGPAGAGKSAIAKKIAELAAERGLLIGSFFFSRTSPTRSTQDRLIATLAYQMTVSIPDTRNHIEEAIERDPALLHKNIQVQIDTLLIKPFQSASTKVIPSPKLLIIDGLDECSDSKTQVDILDAISRSFTKQKLPIICLVVSRPETDISSSFNGNEPLKSIHRRLALDNKYHPDKDIHRFFSDKFRQIRDTHRLKSTIPVPWPTQETLDALIEKSSGQFIFAATVVRFVESNRHRPTARLNMILEMSESLPATLNPFTELDALYKQILSSVEDIELTLRILSLHISSSDLAHFIGYRGESDRFLSLEEGDIDLALIGLSSIVSYDEPSGQVKFLHASFVDFLSDKRRSDKFYIDMASARTEFACCTLQYVKGPDGIRAGNLDALNTGINGEPLLINCQLRNEMLNFDLDAFITAARTSERIISNVLYVWIDIISNMGLENDDEQLLVDRYRNSFESRIQKYQPDWRLQILLTLTMIIDDQPWENTVLWKCIYLNILLEMDDSLHLIDQDALRLYCHSGTKFRVFTAKLRDITFRYVDGDRYASAALHCMRFLSSPPKYSGTGSNVGPEKAKISCEWKTTCDGVLVMLCKLLERANTSPEVMQFMSDHDIDTTVQKNCPVSHIWWLDTHILAFLNRGGVCVNWRIISAIRRARALSSTDIRKTAGWSSVSLSLVQATGKFIPTTETYLGL